MLGGRSRVGPHNNIRSFLKIDLPLEKMAAVGRSLGRLVSNRSFFFVCDMQEKFRPSIRYFPEIITVTQRMVRVCTCCLHVLSSQLVSSSKV